MEPRKLRWIGFFPVLCALSGAPALSAQGNVTCDALVGFNGTVREGRYAPVLLSVENPGRRLQATVSLAVTWGPLRGRQPGLTVTRTAVLDESSTTRLPFVIPIPRNVHAIHATVTAADAQVGSLDVDPRSLTEAGRIVVGVASDLSLDGISALGGSDGSLRVAYPRIDDLPRSWAGYDGVDAIVVHDTYFRQLRAEQVEAMERWVLSGGVLVFTGGAAALQHQEAGFGDLLPVTINGITQRSGISLSLDPGVPRRIPGRVELADATVSRGRVVAADGSLPLMVQRSLGRGKIWFLAFDPTMQPVASWDGTLSLWRHLIGGDRRPVFEAALTPAMEDPWMAALFPTAHVSFPPVHAALVFVAAYLGLLAPLLLVRRRNDKLRSPTRLLLLCAVCGAACAAGWLVFNRVLFSPSLEVMDAASVEARSEDGMAYVTEKAAFYSASARSVEARIGLPDAVVAASGPIAAQGLPAVDPHLFLAADAFGTRVDGIDLDRLGARLLSVQDAVPFPVSASVGTAGSSVQVVVTNGGGKPLFRCYVIDAGRAFSIGDVAAGETATRSFSLADGLGPSLAGKMIPGDDARRAALFKAQEGEGLTSEGPPRLIGWMDAPVLPITFPGSQPVGSSPGLALVSVEAE